MNNLKLELYADPLGDLYVEYKIPINLIQGNEINISLPTYKYEMSYFFGIPVPFSSLAENIETTIFQVSIDTINQIINYDHKKKFKGQNLLSVYLNEAQLLLKDKIVIIQFVVKNLVTRDKVFFNFVYTLFSPFNKKVEAEIIVKAKFSYHISSYRFKTVLIDILTGRIDHDTGILKHKRIGDYIYGHGENIILSPKGNLDLHVHASRLPFKIDRRVFWIAIFIWILASISGIIGFITFLIKSIDL